jgi:hypothetical protein
MQMEIGLQTILNRQRIKDVDKQLKNKIQAFVLKANLFDCL